MAGIKLSPASQTRNNMELNNEKMDKIFTPSEEEQILLILQGKCPHNRGWRHVGHGHNDDCYECKLCGKYRWW